MYIYIYIHTHTYTHTDRKVYYKELAHAITKAEKSQDLQLASQRGTADNTVQVQA